VFNGYRVSTERNENILEIVVWLYNGSIVINN
jgi:hypothetical protein